MARKDFRILVAIDDGRFSRSVSGKLRRHYTVHAARDVQELSDLVHRKDFDLIIIDYRFSRMKAEDIYQGIALLHPESDFIIYSSKDKKEVALKLWKRRAMDYIMHTGSLAVFSEEVNKCVRWTIQKREVANLQDRIDELTETIREISRKIEKTL